jgi:cytochrome c556
MFAHAIRETNMSRSIGGTLAIAVAAIGISSVALAQDQNPATPNEVIFARKALMNSIGANMYVIDQMLETGNIDPVSGRANADTISAMLMAFPHLFPSSTNLWTAGNAARNPATDTLADAAIWESRSFFYKESMAASQYAFDASRAQTVAEFRKSARDLRQTCDGCHATFQHKD